MPVGVQLDFAGATLAQYDEVIETMGFLPGGPIAPTALFHWVTKTDDGIRIIDMWESRDGSRATLRRRAVGSFRRSAFPVRPRFSSSRSTTTFPAGARGPDEQACARDRRGPSSHNSLRLDVNLLRGMPGSTLANTAATARS